MDERPVGSTTPRGVPRKMNRKEVRWWSKTAVPVIAALIGGGLALWSSVYTITAQQESSRKDSIREQRSLVYAEYLEAAVRYQNALNKYTWVLPDPSLGENAPVTDPAAPAIYEETLTARENFVNKTTRAQLLQCENVAQKQKEIDEKLYSTHNLVGSGLDDHAAGRESKMTNTKIREKLENFSPQMDYLRKDYSQLIKENFQGEEECVDGSATKNMFDIFSAGADKK